MQKKVSTVALVLSFAAIVALAIIMIGCGSSIKSNSLTQAQAQAVASAVSTGVSQSVEAAFGAREFKPVNGVAHIEQPEPRSSSFNCTTTPTGESCSATVDSTYSCPAGGTIAVSGNVSGTFSGTSGSAQEQITATPASCVVDGLTINGDPSITVAGQINISNSLPVFPITATETGGVSFGPNPSGSCTFNVSVSVSSSLACTISGTACGQTLNGGC